MFNCSLSSQKSVKIIPGLPNKAYLREKRGDKTNKKMIQSILNLGTDPEGVRVKG